ncbi:hypothetical protein [Gemmatimonas aurantiaca]|uniref:hypothetical protein n=1 Tax=Gemmatimonas aurantiaca TaxID=173480 RepID=UPI00301D9430
MPLDTVETAQLQRDIVRAVTHDLGSIAGALALRAELGDGRDSAAAEKQKMVLKSLAEQIRAAMRLLEVVRGGDGRSEMGANRSAPAGWWLEQLQRLVMTILPRGSTGHVSGVEHASALNLSEQEIAALTMLGLAALHHMQIRGENGSVVFGIRVERERSPANGPEGLTLSITMEAGFLADGRSPRLRARRSRWQRYADAQVRELGWGMRWWQPCGTDGFIWQCVLTPAAGD